MSPPSIELDDLVLFGRGLTRPTQATSNRLNSNAELH